jgi:hypothetical protein
VGVGRPNRYDDDGRVPQEPGEVVLSMPDLREVSRYSAECAQEVLDIFEQDHADDRRPRDAIAAAWAFARGGKRGKALRDAAWAALKAAGEMNTAAAGDATSSAAAAGDATSSAAAAVGAARAAMAAASAAYLHPLADAHQVKHILGAAAHAARSVELRAGDDPHVGAAHLEHTRRLASPAVVDVLRRYPVAPAGGGRVGELMRELDTALRGRS